MQCRRPQFIPGLGRSTAERIGYPLRCSLVSLVAQLVKNLPAMQETWVQSLGWEDPLEEGKATHSSILASRIPRTVLSTGSQSLTRLSDFHFMYIYYVFIYIYRRPEEKGTAEDEMVGWHHQLDGYEFEQVLGVGDRQGSLACCSQWDCKESDTTE